MRIPNKSIPTMIRLYLPGFLAGIVGLVFIFAALIKSSEMELFINQIRAYDIISSRALITLVAWGFIIIELVLGAGLLTGFLQKVTLPLTAFVLVIFMLANLYALVTGSTSDCGCFGSVLERTPLETIVEDIVLFSAVLFAWIKGIRPLFDRKHYSLYIMILAFLAGLLLPILSGFSLKSIFISETEYGERFLDTLSRINLSNINLNQDDYLVVLMSTECLECRDSIFKLNIISDIEHMPRIIALCANTDEQISKFRLEFQPFFPLIKIGEDALVHLLGNGDLPRIILLNNGDVSKVWDDNVPGAEDIKKALNLY